MREPATAIDPADLEVCLRVLAQLDELDVEHPDAVAVRRATAAVFKTVKERRRAARRDAVRAADATVTAATATAAPGRIDDETNGRPLTTGANGNGSGTSAGTLLRSRACYVCKQRYLTVDAFYHQLCPDCAAFNHARREARTDLRGRRALLTGGRAKIGMYIALRLLRDGADTTITTRFPRDAVRRFTAMADSADWLHRLHVVGIDLRDPGQVIALADTVARRRPARHPHQQRRADRAAPRALLRAAGGSGGGRAALRARARHRELRSQRRRSPGRAAGAGRRAADRRRRRPAARRRARATAGCSASTRSTSASCSRSSCAT